MKSVKAYESEVDFAKDFVLEEMEGLLKQAKTYNKCPISLEGEKAALYEITHSLLEDESCLWFYNLRDKEKVLREFNSATKGMIDYIIGMLRVYSKVRRVVEEYLKGK